MNHLSIKRVAFSFGLLLCGIGLLWGGLGVARANVGLSGPVTAEAGIDGVTIRWTTGTEIDTNAFYLLRSTSEAGPFQPVPICVRDVNDANAMVNTIFPWGDVAGFSYEVVDLAKDLDFSGQPVEDLIVGQTYFYLLVEDDGAYKPFLGDIASATYSLMGGGPTASAEICPQPLTLPGMAPIPLLTQRLYLPAVQR